MSDKEKKKESEKKRNIDSINDLTAGLPPEVLNVAQKVPIEDMEKHFPHLHAEISDDEMILGIDNVEGSFSPSKGTDDLSITDDPLIDFDPTVIDFLSRAKTEEEAKEIIDFSQQQGHLTAEEALQLLEQLQKDGVRSFGPIRTSGHYFQKAAEIRNRRVIHRRYSTSK